MLTEPHRSSIFHSFEDLLGHDEAAALMNEFPPYEWPDLLTKEHLDLRLGIATADIDGRFAVVDQQFDTLTADIDGRFAVIDQRFAVVDQRFDTLTADIDGRFAVVDQRFDTLTADIDGRFASTTAELRHEMAQHTNKLLAAIFGAVVAAPAVWTGFETLLS